MGGVSTDIEQSYTATVLNTAKSISKGLVKISETVVNSVVSKSKSTSTTSSTTSGGHSPRLSDNSNRTNKQRHDSKEEYQPGICTIVDTKKYLNNQNRSKSLHDENQNWIVAHFLSHQEPIYALEFNPNGRLLVSADCLGQYFNVFHINPSPYKCTRTQVKHLYSLYRGDTSAKVRNLSFSNDSRWLAVGTKRGTTHIFPINVLGGPVNARTHSKPYVVNRLSKHQRTAGFVDQDDMLSLNGHLPQHSNLIKINGNNGNVDLQQQQMQQQYDLCSASSPIVLNNNPKLKSLIEPFVISTYGQLKQPNANSSFQSSVISSTGTNPSTLLSNGGSSTQTSNNQQSTGNNQNTANSTGSSNPNILAGLTGSNLAASAFSSAALVTENVTNFASNTSNMIQYDNVCAVAVFAESRGYLSPEEPRDFSLNRLKPANSLFIISDVNGNLVEYVLDVIVDTTKMAGNKPTNDSPIQLKLTPKAQWPLQRFISSDEVRYPISIDNPLLSNGLNKIHPNNSNNIRKQSNGSDSASYSPNSLISNNSPSSLSFMTAPNTLMSNQFNSLGSNAAGNGNNNNNNNNEWIKQIEVNTHVGPHRRLFMGPQFVFKTFNSNLTTTMLNPSSSSVIGDTETPIIDLSGDIELNSLDLSAASNNSGHQPSGPRKYSSSLSHYNNIHHHNSTGPMLININSSKSQKLQHQMYQKQLDCTPTFIEVGAGSFQEGMPILCGSSAESHGSQKSLNNDLLGENLIESLADAMNETLLPHGSSHGHNNSSKRHLATLDPNAASLIATTASKASPKLGSKSPAIAITNQQNLLLMNATASSSTTIVPDRSSVGSNSSGVFTAGSYFLVNPTLPSSNGPTVNTSLTSCTSSSSAASSSSSSGRTSNGDGSKRDSNGSNNDDESSVSSNHSSTHGSLSRPNEQDLNGAFSSSHNAKINSSKHGQENILFQDDNLLH